MLLVFFFSAEERGASNVVRRRISGLIGKTLGLCYCCFTLLLLLLWLELINLCSICVIDILTSHFFIQAVKDFRGHIASFKHESGGVG